MIQGNKIYLGALEPKNLEQLRAWRNTPELRKYFREYRELSSKHQEQWFNIILGDRNQVNFEIHDIESTKLLGHCGLYYIDWINRHAEFGIYIGNEDFRQGGYGSDALRTLIRYGFDNLNLNKIWCEVYSNNKASDVYKHIGFTHEGTLRQHYWSEGQWWDSHMMSLLREEWNRVE